MLPDAHAPLTSLLVQQLRFDWLAADFGTETNIPGNRVNEELTSENHGMVQASADCVFDASLVPGICMERFSSLKGLDNKFLESHQCARARNIFILRRGTTNHVLLVPQSRQRINSGRSPCRRIASENRGA